MTDRLLGLEDFQDCVDADFVALDPEIAPAAFVLLEARALRAHDRPEFRQPFVLTFRLPGEIVFPQSIYELRHPTLGATSIFLVPVAQDAAGVSYEAIFN